MRGARRRARHQGRAIQFDDLIAEIRGAVRARSEAYLRRCAIHEAGHTAILLLERPEALRKVSIRQTGDTGGGVLASRTDEIITRSMMLGHLRMMLGGRAAEEVILGAASTGAGGDPESDLARATALAVSLVGAYGLDDDEGLLLAWTADRRQSEPTALAQAVIGRPSQNAAQRSL